MPNLYPDALIDSQGVIRDFYTDVELPSYEGLVYHPKSGYVLYLTLNPDGTRKWETVSQGCHLVMAEIEEFLIRSGPEDTIEK